MRATDPRLLVLALTLLGGTVGCTKPSAAAPKAEKVEASVLERAQGAERSHVRLTSQAAGRLEIATAKILAAPGSARSVPGSALIYDEQGATWVYMQDGPLRYLRVPVTVQATSGAVLHLSAGPAVGTAVVTTGAAELYGAEAGVH